MSMTMPIFLSGLIMIIAFLLGFHVFLIADQPVVLFHTGLSPSHGLSTGRQREPPPHVAKAAPSFPRPDCQKPRHSRGGRKLKQHAVDGLSSNYQKAPPSNPPPPPSPPHVAKAAPSLPRPDCQKPRHSLRGRKLKQYAGNGLSSNYQKAPPSNPPPPPPSSAPRW